MKFISAAFTLAPESVLMKNPSFLAGHSLAFLLCIFLFVSGCKKSDEINAGVIPSIYVMSTTPVEEETGQRYDENIDVTLNTSFDTTKFSVSFELFQNDSLRDGLVSVSGNKISFTPQVELLPLTKYAVTLIIRKKNDSFPVLIYRWGFTTKVQDSFKMTQRSTRVTDFNRDGSRSMQIGNYLYSFGGWVPDRSFNDVYRSSGDLQAWEKIRDAPWHGRHVYGIAKIADSTYVLGGDNTQNLFDVWRTIDGENWTLLADDILNYRVFYGCTTHNGYIYVVGGSGFHDVWRSRNGVNWEQVTDHVAFLKGEGFAGSLVSFKGKLWMICGGTNGYGQGDIRQEVWSSVDGKEWKREKDFGGSKRYYTDVCVWDNKLWVVGGYNYEEGNTKSIWYMKADGTWKEFETPADYIGRHATGVAVYNNQLAITCGNFNNDCWVIEKVQ